MPSVEEIRLGTNRAPSPASACIFPSPWFLIFCFLGRSLWLNTRVAMGQFPRSCLSTTRCISNPETASLFLDKLTGSQYIDAKSSDRTSLVNPYDGSSIPRRVHVAGKDDVDIAVSAALKAYKGEWSTYSPAQRQACMLRFADLVERNAERLAALESLPTGRPVTPTMQFDIAHMAQVYRCMRLSAHCVLLELRR